MSLHYAIGCTRLRELFLRFARLLLRSVSRAHPNAFSVRVKERCRRSAHQEGDSGEYSASPAVSDRTIHCRRERCQRQIDEIQAPEARTVGRKLFSGKRKTVRHHMQEQHREATYQRESETARRPEADRRGQRRRRMQREGVAAVANRKRTGSPSVSGWKRTSYSLLMLGRSESSRDRSGRGRCLQRR